MEGGLGSVAFLPHAAHGSEALASKEEGENWCFGFI